MNKQNLKNILSASVRILLAFVFVFGQTAWAGQNQDPKAKLDAGEKEKVQQSQANPSPLAATKARPMEEENTADQKTSSNGRHEGIKVHGWWTIEVRNPDGTVVTHREFENSLQAQGAATLASILSGGQSAGFWLIYLVGSPSPCFESLPAAGGPNPAACTIAPSGFNLFPGATSWFQTAVITSSAGQLTLSGTAVAGESGNVQTVSTNSYTCAATIAPSNCAPAARNGNAALFTSAQLQTAIAVTTGQTIAVTVVISFS